MATPATSFPSSTYPVHYDELLSFARRIAKFTLPPTYRETPPTPSLPSSMPPSAAPTNGTTTPTGGNTPAAAISGLTALANGMLSVVEETAVKTALPPHLAEWLNPLAQSAEFAPWPSEETIRRGALAQIQVLVDEGKDPATWDPAKAAQEEEERKRQEEEWEKKQEEERKAQMANMEQQARERAEATANLQAEGGQASAALQRGEKKAYTGLDDLDDDDSD